MKTTAAKRQELRESCARAEFVDYPSTCIELIDDLDELLATLEECERAIHIVDDTWGPSKIIARARARIRAVLKGQR